MLLTRKIALISLLAALSIVGRIYMTAIPNVQPSTVIIIITGLVFGARFGLTLALLTAIGSDLVLGIGFFTVMQILAWGVIGLASGFLSHVHKKVPMLIMAVYAGFCGYLFGFLVSLNVLIGGVPSFIAYWLMGLPFDTYHAVGNFLFYLVLSPVLIRLLEAEKKKLKI
ncbi:ECF transporter S component [Sporolactobacillus nakayamae]|uniref:Energy-coupling factor transport system substrate-specific component n=1 Tax=Sporolactobacillus nakayamae TaxID=269670 RepID=A0A1I2UEE1_9BACL|nr:ECF transporter S component [Sporolactobacillus nakayamae]SFG74749.1 energy-coupling factor transport system substrate-specific component [Sporolactobacillus nakayamae]